MDSRVECPKLEINHAVNAYNTPGEWGNYTHVFPPEVERAYDRSMGRFIALYK